MHELFKRYDGNPILTPQDWPYPANAVLNPGAIRLSNETILLVRVEDVHRCSHFTVARSADGLTNWRIDPGPTVEPDTRSSEERHGLADPRIVWVVEQKTYFVTYTSYTNDGCAVSLAITRNFKTFARLGVIAPPESKDACIFPRRFKARFTLIYQSNVYGEIAIHVVFSPDLKHWGDHRPLIRKRPGHWDCHKVGLACPPIEIKKGWILFYYGVEYTSGGTVCRVGVALLDLDSPWRVLRRCNEWVFEPSETYEHVGDVGGVVFPTGAVVNKEEDRLTLYYGAANSTVAVAEANFSDVIGYVLSCPEVK